MKKKSTDENLTELVYILDRSGSMRGMEEPAVEAFNRFLGEQREVEGEANLTLVLFDTEFDRPIDGIPLREVTEITAADFRPRGCTALLDAIGLSIKRTRKRIRTMDETDRPATVIFAIFTDGLENSSEIYTWKEIARKIRKRTQEDGWEFLFLGANQDAIATAAQMNIAAHNSSNVMFCRDGISSSGEAWNRKVRALRRRKAGLVGEDDADLLASMSKIVAEEHEKEGRKSGGE